MGRITHGNCIGGKPTPEYRAWHDMLHRCYNPKNKRYVSYGGRGIYVCGRWRAAFANFLMDMGPRPDGYTLERLDNNAGYRPENCKWGTQHEQAHNRRDVRLSWEKTREIRALYPELSQYALAQLFNVDRTTIASLVRGETWKEQRI